MEIKIIKGRLHISDTCIVKVYKNIYCKISVASTPVKVFWGKLLWLMVSMLKISCSKPVD